MKSQILSNYTSGWVLSEVIRQIQNKYGSQPICNQHSFKHVVGLKMKDGTELIDYWLTQYERPMPPIQDHDELEILYSGNKIILP